MSLVKDCGLKTIIILDIFGLLKRGLSHLDLRAPKGFCKDHDLRTSKVWWLDNYLEYLILQFDHF